MVAIFIMAEEIGMAVLSMLFFITANQDFKNKRSCDQPARETWLPAAVFFNISLIFASDILTLNQLPVKM